MNIKQSSLLMPSAGENFFPDKNMVIPSLENMNHIFIDNISSVSYTHLTLPTIA